MLAVAIAALALLVESAIGFGGTLLTLALGTVFLQAPPATLLSLLLPANIALSTVVLLGNRRGVDWRALERVFWPSGAVGFGLGLMGVALVAGAPRWEPVFTRLVGVAIVAAAATELWRGRQAVTSPLGQQLFGLCGGVCQGAYGIGGPFIVLALRQHIHDHNRLRATLALTWLSLNTVLWLVLVTRTPPPPMEQLSVLMLLVPLCALAGQRLARGLPQAATRTAVTTALLLLGLVRTFA